MEMLVTVQFSQIIPHLQLMCHFKKEPKISADMNAKMFPSDLYVRLSNKLNYPGLTTQKCGHKW